VREIGDIGHSIGGTTRRKKFLKKGGEKRKKKGIGNSHALNGEGWELRGPSTGERPGKPVKSNGTSSEKGQHTLSKELGNRGGGDRMKERGVEVGERSSRPLCGRHN